MIRCTACGATRDQALMPSPQVWQTRTCCEPVEPKDTPQWGLMCRMVVACDAGRKWAKGLKVGDEFLGASVAAGQRYPGGEQAVVEMFTWSAFNELEERWPTGIPLDMLGRIVGPGRPRVISFGVGLIDMGVQR